ncbi:MAG: MCP four helix bundle domain-containing protein, partial [Pirellulaceae bacterium]
MSMFSRLSVGSKLFASFTAILALMVIMGGVAVWKMGALNASCVQLAENWMPAINAANRMSTCISTYRVKEYRHVLVDTPEEKTKLEGQMSDIVKELEQNRDTVVRLTSSDEEKQLLNEIETAWDGYVAESQRIQALSRENKRDEAMALITGRSVELFEALDQMLSKDVEMNATGGNGEVAKALTAYSMGRNVTLAILGASILVGLVLAAWISRWFTRAVVEVDDISASVAAAAQQLAEASELLSSGAQQSAA